METFTKAEAVALSAALVDAIGRDKARPNLSGVRVRQSATGTVFDVTDGFRAHQVRVLPVTGETESANRDLWVAEGAAFAKALTVAARDAGKTGTVVLFFDAGTLTVAGPSVRHTFPVGDGPSVAPNTDPLFDKATAAFDGATWGRYNGARLSEAVSAAGAVADMEGPDGYVTVGALSEKTAALVTANGGRFGFSALVMPMRVR